MLAKEISVEAFLASGAAIDTWRSLRLHLGDEIGNGLRRRQSPVPFAIRPRAFRGFAFDELEQCCVLEVVDLDGEILVLTLPAADLETAKQLYERRGHVVAIVAEARVAGSRLVIRPVSMLAGSHGDLTVHNLDFDAWSPDGVREKALRRLQKAFAHGAKPMKRRLDPLDQALSRILDVAIAIVEHTPVRDPEAVTSQCDALGLTYLGRAVRKMLRTMAVRDALAVGYIAAEAETAIALQS